jgi:hypothetical protein
MWCSVNGTVLTDILRDSFAFNFRVKQSKMKARKLFKMLAIMHPATHHHIPQSFILQLQRLLYVKLHNSTVIFNELDIMRRETDCHTHN